ncbi:hypothetical protein BZM27_16265 [Paraburkholderia steynii]|uniref:Peptidase M20 dimerisation domain-containing protein n=1 Tax=Paraburkholderia steynii TaxID=1245441 RepID=A0A4R0XFE4_9BURK|nr:hypothetical protein BZM27_16265 [Paraburkholderia steynii]
MTGSPTVRSFDSIRPTGASSDVSSHDIAPTDQIEGPYLPTLIRLRHELHANPELKLEERGTSRRVVAFLEALGVPLRTGLATTGVVATVYGKGRRPEAQGEQLACARIWMRCPRSSTTAAKRFEIRIVGCGGHAPRPHLSIDPIPIACAIVEQLEVLVSRRTNPLDSAVLTVGKIESGASFNVIPETATIHGTSRPLGTTSRNSCNTIARHVAAAHEASVETKFFSGYPCTDNHRDAADFMGQVMQEIVGESDAHLDIPPAMTANGFSFMPQAVRGAYGFIGNGPFAEQGDGAALHSDISLQRLRRPP